MSFWLVIILVSFVMSCDNISMSEQSQSSENVMSQSDGREGIRPEYNCDSLKADIGPNQEESIYHSELVANNALEAYCLYPERREEALKFLLKTYEGTAPNNSKKDNRASFRKFTYWAQAALELQDEAQISKVNEVLESSKAKPWK